MNDAPFLEGRSTQRNEEQRRAYELKKIEKMPPGVSRMAPVNSGSGPAAPGDIHNVADLFSYVKDNDAVFNPKEASKVVDAKGEPLVFSHYTDNDFDAFDIDKARVNSDVQAFFFAPAGNEDWSDMGKRRVDVYLNIRNPKEGKPIVDMRQNEAGKAAREKLISEGYDGVIERDENGNIVEVLAFYPEQIKSVENIGTFDGTNPNIYLQAAWHGSPFNFDRFSLEHINSGEGAQAFGWGLYFAGKKEISEGYRKRLSSKKAAVLFDGKKPKEFDAIDADELFLAGKITAELNDAPFLEGRSTSN